jgi:hypothetical protein
MGVAEEKNGCGLSGAAVSKREVGVSGSTTGGLRCMTRATKVGVIEERWVVWSTKDGCGRRDMDVVKEESQASPFLAQCACSRSDYRTIERIMLISTYLHWHE